VFRIRTLGSVPYHEAFALQHALARGCDDDYLLVLQHPHVFTLGPHADRSHVLTDPASVGATLEQTDRGGDVTYHGPGQLVAYPIISVPGSPSAGPDHVHRLESVVIATLADLGLPMRRVWISTPACGSTLMDRRHERLPPSVCAPSAAPQAGDARSMALPSTSSATLPCSVILSRAG